MGRHILPEGLTLLGCIRDAAPDALKRRMISNKNLGFLGLEGAGTDTAELDELSYLPEPGFDQLGALCRE